MTSISHSIEKQICSSYVEKMLSYYPMASSLFPIGCSILTAAEFPARIICPPGFKSQVYY
jgi:hypothetical protein